MKTFKDYIEESFNWDRFSMIATEYNLDYNTAADIMQRLKDYQHERITGLGLIRMYSKYKGMKGLFVPNTSSYRLYRGMKLVNDIKNIYYYPLDELKQTGYYTDKDKSCFSWTKDLYQATRFAYGNRTWMDNKKSFDDLERHWGYYGVVIENVFDTRDILFDFEFMEKFLDINTDFVEEEVIVVPKKNAKYKIKEIL